MPRLISEEPLIVSLLREPLILPNSPIRQRLFTLLEGFLRRIRQPEFLGEVAATAIYPMIREAVEQAVKGQRKLLPQAAQPTKPPTKEGRLY